MDDQNRRALLGVMLIAARADGARDEREREAIRGALGRFRGEGLDPESLWQEVESGGRGVEQSARELTSPGTRELAYELATCVCDADGATNERERAFLAELARELGLAIETTERFRREADALAGAARAGGAAEETEELIRNRAILCAALELLPQRLATLAILPLQMQLVYRIGKQHGFELDQGHLKEFLGVVGVGMASQVLEGFARQLFGGLLGGVGGRLLGGLARGATGAGFSFATTYALGHVAERYYQSGRKLSATELRSLFSELVGRAREIEPRHAAEIASAARRVDVGALQRLLA